MRTHYLILPFLILLITCKTNNNRFNQATLSKQSVSDTIHNAVVKDQYRYIENITDTAVLQLLREKTRNTHKILSKITRIQPQTRDSTSIFISAIEITPNNVYYYLKNNSNDDIEKLYSRKGLDGKEVLVFDPNVFSNKEKEPYRINYYKLSHDASKAVISLSKNDAEISKMIVFDIKQKKIISDFINNCWPSALGGIRWLPNNSGFTYEYIPEINKHSEQYLLDIKTMLYTFSSKKNNTKVILSRKNNPDIAIEPEDFPEVNFKSENSDYLFANISGASNYADYYYSSITNVMEDTIKWKVLYKSSDLIKDFLVVGDEMIFLTAKNASNFRICKTSLKNLSIENPEILVREDKTAVISSFAITSEGLFYVKTTNGVISKLYRLNQHGEKEIKLPEKFGYINIYARGVEYANLWIETRGWTSNKELYNYDKNTDSFIKVSLSNNKKSTGLKNVIVEEVEVISHDSVMVPLSIIYKKGLKKNKKNRVLLNAYGAYKWINRPNVHPYLEKWVNNGGIYAVAHVRGGGEKGNAWHKAGYKMTKPNSWKDLIACTEYLIQQEYTTKEKVAVWGGSAGGITVGRAITDRPDLYAAAVIHVGMLNMIRSEFGPNGKNNIKEFGTVKDPNEFRYLYEMDAYHHIQNNINYPAIYLTAGMNDARVPAWQSAKFALRLEEATISKAPVLLDIDFNGGHGLDASKSKQHQKLTNVMSFLNWQTGHPDYQPKKD